MKIIGITQARYGSSRLPGKVLKQVNGKTLLEYHISRLLKSKSINKLILATTYEEESDAIEAVATKLGITCYKGSTEDVLDRYYQVARMEMPDYIVRITSDCPLIDHSVLDSVVESCVAGDYDYCSNSTEPTFPDGLDVEVFKFSALETAWKNAAKKSEREHVTPFILNHSTIKGAELFKGLSYKQKQNDSKYRFTVDYDSDYRVIEQLITSVGEYSNWEDYKAYLDAHPEVTALNNSIKRNEGYIKSVESDKIQLREITNFEKSVQYRKRIHELIPGGAHTYSKGDDQFPEDAPAAISHGNGCHVWDIDGNEYLDCSMGLTSVSLGHAYPPVIEKVEEELKKGINFQRPSYIEKEMAEKFLSLVPQHDMIKFGKNGSLVITAAVKLARAKTGRKLVAFPGDHPFYSYDDWFIGKTACNAGIPEEISSLSVTFKGCDLNSLEELFKQYPEQIACVVAEPERTSCYNCTCKMKPAEFLPRAIDLCHRYGALFIQDEMVTGFKTHFPGSISKFNTVPDMATWGKGIANGFSFCALTGKKNVMEIGGIQKKGNEKVFLISTTHGGETSAIAAGMATIDLFKENDVIGHNHHIGDLLITQCREVIDSKSLAEFIEVVPCNWLVGFVYKDAEKKASNAFRTLFMQEMIKRGVLFQGAFVPCFSHTVEDVNYFTEAFGQSCNVYANALKSGYQKYLKGEEAKPVFRKYL